MFIKWPDIVWDCQNQVGTARCTHLHWMEFIRNINTTKLYLDILFVPTTASDYYTNRSVILTIKFNAGQRGNNQYKFLQEKWKENVLIWVAKGTISELRYSTLCWTNRCKIYKHLVDIVTLSAIIVQVYVIVNKVNQC